MTNQLLSTMLLVFTAAQTTSDDTLTAKGLRALLSSSGMFESNARLIYTQMQQQRAGLPAWWPDDVYASEEAAIQEVDVVDAALPFYQACLAERQADLLTKIVLSKAGQQVAQAALQTHSQAAEQGTSPAAAQVAGEDAGVKTERSISNEEKQKAAASLTPAERAFAAREFTRRNMLRSASA